MLVNKNAPPEYIYPHCNINAFIVSSLTILHNSKWQKFNQENTSLCVYTAHYIVITKGQLISRGLFCVFNSSKKRTKKLDLSVQCYNIYLRSNCFLEELRTPRSPFEINWPLYNNNNESCKVCNILNEFLFEYVQQNSRWSW